MAIKITRHTTYTVSSDDNEFKVEFEPISGTEQVKISGDGNTATVGYLSPDEDGGRFGFYFEENDSGKFYGYDRDVLGYDPKTREETEEIVKQNPGRCFWIAKYEHGLVRYYRSGDAITSDGAESHDETGPAQAGLCIPDQQWDVSPGAALYVAPDDTTDPAKYCDATMEEFSDWCNGAIYGVCVEVFTREGDEWTPAKADACWGHIGYKWATEALAEEMK